jgi:hypothetical protein
MTKAQLTQRNSELISEASSMEAILANKQRKIEKLQDEAAVCIKRNTRLTSLNEERTAELIAANALVKSNRMLFDEARISLDLAKGQIAYLKSLSREYKETIETHNSQSWISRIFSDGLI